MKEYSFTEAQQHFASILDEVKRTLKNPMLNTFHGDAHKSRFSNLVRIFCANLPSQKARGESYNLLLLLRKDCLFCHRSECYGPPSPSISLESIKSLDVYSDALSPAHD